MTRSPEELKRMMEGARMFKSRLTRYLPTDVEIVLDHEHGTIVSLRAQVDKAWAAFLEGLLRGGESRATRRQG